jgi:hypothetical protein
VQGQLSPADLLAGATFEDELLGQRRRLALGDEPADYEAAEQVQQHVQIEVHAHHGSEQFRDIGWKGSAVSHC